MDLSDSEIMLGPAKVTVFLLLLLLLLSRCDLF